MPKKTPKKPTKTKKDDGTALSLLELNLRALSETLMKVDDDLITLEAVKDSLDVSLSAALDQLDKALISMTDLKE